ncbi:ABC transporter permease [Pseudomonas sp. UL073]|uniref:ABC transporter permease n=1 Tax=Zestomonas insulae TaxID=2809017 RepID=A0ABS2IFU6_9GAMM|nr:ABC transporter permease [Pseudomonas insulae]MBM7061961.1 ABC transporter permease [Pseudomonas insulae]
MIETFLLAMRSEFAAVRRNQGVLGILIGAILLYGLLYPTPYSAQVFRDVPVVVVDHDNSELSRQLLRMADASEMVAVKGLARDMRQAREQLYRSEVLGVVEIPHEFERRVLRGEPAVIGVYANAGYLLAYSRVAGAFTEVAMTLGAEVQIEQLLAKGVPPEHARVARAVMPVTIKNLFDPAGGYASYVVPAVLVIILHQTLLIGIGMLSADTRHLPMPPQAARSPGMWVLGRCVPYLLIYAINSLFFFGVIFRLYNLPSQGDGWQLVPFMALFLLATTLLGVVVGNLFRSSITVGQVLLFTSLPGVFLSGFSWPKEMLPEPLVWLSRLLPSTPGVEGFLRLHQMGASYRQIEWPLLNLALLVLLFWLVARWLTRRRAMAAG